MQRPVPPLNPASILASVLAQAEAYRPLDSAIISDLSKTSPNGILFLDKAGCILYANETARREVRIDPTQFGKTIWDIYPQMLGTALEKAYQGAVATGQRRVLKEYFYEPFGTWSDIDILPRERGTAIYWRDVTSRVRLQQERDLATRQMYQVLESTTDSVFCVDYQWQITYANQHAKEGLSARGGLTGTDLWENFPEVAHEGSPNTYHLYRAMSERISVDYEVYNTVMRSWFRVIAGPSEDGIIIFFRDKTVQKKAEAALREDEKLVVVAQLASSIAHDINNPLACLTNLIYLAEMQAETPELSRYLDLAQREIRRIALIGRRSVRFHKQLSAPADLRCEDLYGEVLHAFEARLCNSGVRVEQRLRALQLIECWSGDIAQMLNELTSNALAGMPLGGRLLVRSREATAWSSGQRGITLTIADTGPGIDATALKRLFEPFYTTKGIGGIGLGLWLSRDIVNRHRGEIRVRSSRMEGHTGTVVTVFLPLEPKLVP